MSKTDYQLDHTYNQWGRLWWIRVVLTSLLPDIHFTNPKNTLYKNLDKIGIRIGV